MRAIDKQMLEARNKEKSMPGMMDYARAHVYLKEKELPVTLIEMYDYLGE